MNIEDKAYFDGGYFRTAATPLSVFTKDLRETLRRFAAIVNCPILGYGKLTTQNEFSNKINQLKTWIVADIAKMENDKLKETVPAMAIHRHHWIRDRKEVIAELKKIEDTKISLLPTVAKNAMPVKDKAYFDRRIYHSTGTFQTKLDKETRVPIDGTSKWVTVDPAQYITPRRVRISGIKGEIEIAAQLSGDEIKGISAKSVKATAARQGSKSRFAKEYILWALPKGETDRLHERPIAEGLYTPAQVDEVKRKATAAGWHSFRVAAMMGFDDMTNAFKGKGIKKGSSRAGTKIKFEKEWTEAGFSASFFIKKLQGMMAVYQGENDNEYRNKIIGYAKTLANHPDFVFNGVSSQALAKKAFTLVKFKYARVGNKEKFYLDPSNISLILKRVDSENRQNLQIVKQKQATNKKSDLMDAANLAHGMAYSNEYANHLNDLRKILQSKNPSYKQAAKEAISKIEAIESSWQTKYSELQSQYKAAHSRQGSKAKFANFSKSKFANRGAFAEASSSPVLGSLLEKKVMPEGGWRAVETDGAALVIAFEDNDIAGNFARRAAENGYSATAPMAMAGRYWNVKVQNENKN